MRTYFELVNQIKDAVRKEAKRIPSFGGVGAIRITAYPLCDRAYAWLNGNPQEHYPSLKDTKFDDYAVCEHVFPIVKCGSLIRDFGNAVDPMRVSFYAYSAMKGAYCVFMHEKTGSRVAPQRSWEPNDDITEKNGFGPARGATFINLMKEPLGNIMCGDFEECYKFFDLCISVCGASPEEDERCALARLKVLEDFDDELFDGDTYED